MTSNATAKADDTVSCTDDHAMAIPQLPSPNLKETRAFYQDYLGFRSTYFDPDMFLILTRDKLELHFWLCSNLDEDKQQTLCNNSSCYIRGGTDALFTEFSVAKVPRLSAFETRPWNMKEFYVHDVHGNLLKFGRAPREDESK